MADYKNLYFNLYGELEDLAEALSNGSTTKEGAIRKIRQMEWKYESRFMEQEETPLEMLPIKSGKGKNEDDDRGSGGVCS